MSVDVVLHLPVGTNLEMVGQCFAVWSGAEGNFLKGMFSIPSLKFRSLSTKEWGFPQWVAAEWLGLEDATGLSMKITLSMESTSSPGILLSSTPLWIALSSKAVRTFGGVLLNAEDDSEIIGVREEDALFPLARQKEGILARADFVSKERPLFPEEIMSASSHAANTRFLEAETRSFVLLQAKTMLERVGKHVPQKDNLSL